MQHPTHAPTAGPPRLAYGRWPSSLAAVALVAGVFLVARRGRTAPPVVSPPPPGTIRAVGYLTDPSCAWGLTSSARCELDVDPVPPRGRLNCRVTIRCGGRTLYGGEGLGYVHCRYVGSVPDAVEDRMTAERDGDPALTWNGGAGVAVVDVGTATSPNRCVVTAR